MCGLTWFLGGDVKSRAAGTKSSAVLGSDRYQIDCAALQAREQRCGVDNPHPLCFVLLWSFLPKEDLDRRCESCHRPQTILSTFSFLHFPLTVHKPVQICKVKSNLIYFANFLLRVSKCVSKVICLEYYCIVHIGCHKLAQEMWQ